MLDLAAKPVLHAAPKLSAKFMQQHQSPLSGVAIFMYLPMKCSCASGVKSPYWGFTLQDHSIVDGMQH